MSWLVGAIAWRGFGPFDPRRAASTGARGREHAQYQDRTLVVAVLECVCSAEYRQDDLAVVVTIAKWPSQPRMPPEPVSSRNQVAGNAGGEFWKLVVEEGGEAIEITLAPASRSVLSSAASSAISWGTVTPSSAARTSSTSAVCWSMSDADVCSHDARITDPGSRAARGSGAGGRFDSSVGWRSRTPASR